MGAQREREGKRSGWDPGGAEKGTEEDWSPCERKEVIEEGVQETKEGEL